jgi:hypothetical protein
MKRLLKLISFAGLALMFISAVLIFSGATARGTYLALALLGTVIWFVTVPFWMERRLHQSE